MRARGLQIARRLRFRQSPRPARRAALTFVLAATFAGAALPLGAGTEATIVTSAEFAEPTLRYAHAVLGDDVEYGALILHRSNLKAGTALRSNAVLRREKITIRLPLTRVFEDLAPRLVDLDDDGAPEVMVVESDAQKGAQLAIYDASGTKIAATPHIGTRFRWLAPIGAADLDGDGHIEVAYVDRPHLAKTLRIWRFREGALEQVASTPGLTNHRIGEDFITSGIRNCGQGPEIVTANANWSRIMVSTLEDGQIRTRDIGAFDPKTRLTAALACEVN